MRRFPAKRGWVGGVVLLLLLVGVLLGSMHALLLLAVCALLVLPV